MYILHKRKYQLHQTPLLQIYHQIFSHSPFQFWAQLRYCTEFCDDNQRCIYLAFFFLTSFQIIFAPEKQFSGLSKIKEFQVFSPILIACMAIRLILLRRICANPIACMGNFWGDPPCTEPAYAENRVVGEAGRYNQSLHKISLGSRRVAVFLFWVRRLFFIWVGGGWCPTFCFLKSIENNMVYSLGIYIYTQAKGIFAEQKSCGF